MTNNNFLDASFNNINDILTDDFVTHTDDVLSFITELKTYLMTTEYMNEKDSCFKSEEPILLLDYILGYESDQKLANNFIFSFPKYDIAVISFIKNSDDLDLAYDFYYELCEDISLYIKDYDYNQLLGRGRKKLYHIKHIILYDNDEYLKNNNENDKKYIKLDNEINIITEIFKCIEKKKDYENKRRIKALRSILTQSINDSKEVNNSNISRLDIVKNYIKNYDKEQLNFIHYTTGKKTIRIQGIAGSGKTFLLLHRLIREYIKNHNSKIIMTCHNKSLAQELRNNIKYLANILKIKEQIDWENRLFLSHAWDIYKLICFKLGLDYYPFDSRDKMSFKKSCNNALNQLATMNIKPIFDFVFIDETQDLPNEWVKLCEIISKKVYVAFDIFQNIFDNIQYLSKETECDYTLTYCYRTPPLLLMFAHSIAMGLFEEKKIQWFNKSEYWEKCGYKINGNPEEDGSELLLIRQPLSRFENEDIEDKEKEIYSHFYNCSNIDINDNENISLEIINIINNIKQKNNIESDRFHEIMIIDNRNDYNMAMNLAYILEYNGIEVNNLINTKNRSYDNKVQFANINHVKGLEFGFVILIDIKLKDSIKSRNSIYMSITRTLLESHIMFFDEKTFQFLKTNYDSLISDKCIRTIVPTETERNLIAKRFNVTDEVDWREYISNILDAENYKGDKEAFIKVISDIIYNSNDDIFINNEVVKAKIHEILGINTK